MLEEVEDVTAANTDRTDNINSMDLQTPHYLAIGHHPSTFPVPFWSNDPR